MSSIYFRGQILVILTHNTKVLCSYIIYRKVPKFSDTRKHCCNLPNIQTKRPNLRVFPQKDANGTANSEDPDQTAPLGNLGSLQ